jgi:ubiquinone/menaquinone biosynthesis C-methylase UbiE
VPSDHTHWQNAYAESNSDQVSWYEPRPERSLALIEASSVSRDAAIIDVGGGASSLAAHLLDAGYSDVTVADIAPGALAQAQAHLGTESGRVNWIAADVRTHHFDRRYELWHDRAVFHFMVDTADRDGYLAVLRRTLLPGGQVIIATFGPDGPTRCSGLPVQRYRAEQLTNVLGEEFQLVSSSVASHQTPGGKTQQFLYAHLSRGAAS